MSFDKPKAPFEVKPLYNDWEVWNDEGKRLGEETEDFAHTIFRRIVEDGYSIRQASQIMCDAVRGVEAEVCLRRNINAKSKMNDAARKQMLDRVEARRKEVKHD